MSKPRPSNQRTPAARQSRNRTMIIAGILALLAIGAVFLQSGLDTGGQAGGDLKIVKSEITEKAKFYPYRVGSVKMEVLAVRASDGTIRTAFNTCQVCFDSGRGYYRQQGDALICQNCGNRFRLDEIEKEIGGCNPVPILPENKTEDDEYITISQAFLEQNKGLFVNWRR
ncbi:MAG TPA: DUF2318 domain-containing protein [Clostridia bacterium]|nr:DUF2318 domain-containing protein [Clostridia bacterium]